MSYATENKKSVKSANKLKRAFSLFTSATIKKAFEIKRVMNKLKARSTEFDGVTS